MATAGKVPLLGFKAGAIGYVVTLGFDSGAVASGIATLADEPRFEAGIDDGGVWLATVSDAQTFADQVSDE